MQGKICTLFLLITYILLLINRIRATGIDLINKGKEDLAANILDKVIEEGEEDLSKVENNGFEIYQKVDTELGETNVDIDLDALAEVEPTDGTLGTEVILDIEMQSERDKQISQPETVETAREDSNAADGIITLELETEISYDARTEKDLEESTTLATIAEDLLSCEIAGTFADENDCRKYVRCILNNTTNELEKAQQSCPTKQAFHQELSHCTRDLSPCADAFICSMAGTFADLNDKSAYYWCVGSRLNVSSYYVYHVQCGNGQIYTPELGKCFVDMMNLQDLPLNYEIYLSKSLDEESVREEVKLLRAEEKAKLKEAKLLEKIRKKYEKELRKKAAKEAKEQAKRREISLEGENKSFY